MMLVLHRIQMHIRCLCELLRQPRQFEIMRRKQGIAAILFQQIAGNCKGQRQAVKS